MTRSPSTHALGALLLALSLAGCDCRPPDSARSWGQIQLEYEEAGVTQLGESATYDFGTVSMGKTVTLKIRVNNTGSGVLTVDTFEKVDGASVQLGTTTVEADPVFLVDYQSPTDIPQGGTGAFTLTFKPPLDAVNQQVDWRAHLRLRALNAEPGKETADIEVRGTAISGVCELPSTIDFGGVARGDTSQSVITLKNGQPIDTLAWVGPIVSARGGSVFTYTPDTPQGEFTLASGKSRDVTITFSPTEGREYSAIATLRAAEGCPDVKVRLMGTGVDSVLTWSPSTVDFGYVAPGGEATSEVTFSNLGTMDAHLTALSVFEGANVSALYTVSDTGTPDRTSLTVPAGHRDPTSGAMVPGTARVTMTFKPQALGLKQALLKATTDLRAQSAIAVPLKGVGGGPAIDLKPSPLLNFGRVAYFQTASPPSFASRRITVQNVGTRPNPPDARANLRLGAGGAGAPYWRVTAKNGNTTVNELCLGAFDAATQTCANTLPTTDPGSYDPAVGLEASGATALLDIPVRVTPASLGAKEWEVVFFSNDPHTPERVITIQANAVELPPCTLSVKPLNLNFGVVAPPSSRDLSFEVKNLSPDHASVCLLTNLDLRAGSDPMFSLPRGAVAEVELYGGDTMTVTARAWPQGQVPSAPTQVSGAVIFNVSNPTAPEVTVNLSATLATACLTVSPLDLDFGTVGQGCNAPDRTFQLYNTCSQPITLQSAQMLAPAGEPPGGPNCPGTAACPEFLTVSAPPAQTIAAGSSTPVSFSLKYRPINLGQDNGAFLISVLQDGRSVDYLITLTGKGDTMGLNTDTFRQDASPKADILVIVDNSCSMSDKQASLASNFASFVKYAMATGVDFQIGVTTTDMGYERGRLVASSSGTKIFRPTTTALEQQFSQAVHQGSGGSSRETCLEPSVAALTAPLINDPYNNAGFLRSDAVLAIVCVTDAVDQAAYPAPYYLSQLVNIKGAQRPSAFTYNVIGPFNAPTPTCIYDTTADDGTHAYMVAQTNGVKEEICTPDWAKALENIGRLAFGYRTNFYLTARPDLSSGKTITVQINGTTVQAVEPVHNTRAWDYDATTNSIVFQPLFVPQPGDTLTVTYQVACIP